MSMSLPVRDSVIIVCFFVAIERSFMIDEWLCHESDDQPSIVDHKKMIGLPVIIGITDDASLRGVKSGTKRKS